MILTLSHNINCVKSEDDGNTKRTHHLADLNLFLLFSFCQEKLYDSWHINKIITFNIIVYLE